MTRSVFQTGTGQTATVAAIAGLLVAIAPNVSGIIARKYPENKADIEDTTAALVQVLGLISLAGGAGALANRATATDKVYSPSWLPGFSKEDLEEKIEPVAHFLRQSRPDMHEQVATLAAQQAQRVDPAEMDRVNVPKNVVSNPQDAI
jgi:hypothetical protein